MAVNNRGRNSTNGDSNAWNSRAGEIFLDNTVFINHKIYFNNKTTTEYSACTTFSLGIKGVEHRTTKGTKWSVFKCAKAVSSRCQDFVLKFLQFFSIIK